MIRRISYICLNKVLIKQKCTLRMSHRVYCSGLGLWKEDISIDIKHAIESHWRTKLYNRPFDDHNTKDKYYVLSMFPYPSGQLHMGHVRVYTISDTMARFYRMNGKNVLHPIGWDAFGLPAENAAIEHNVSAKSWTERNIQNMKKQLYQLSCSFDWDREVTTCSSDYYKWTQYLFLMLFKEGLIYRKYALVNWDPVDNTVLADEQVDDNGCSWRSGAKVLKYFELVNASNIKSLTVWTKHIEKIDEATFIAVTPNSIFHQMEKGNKLNNGFYKLHVKAKNPFTGKLLPIYITDQVEYPPECDCHIGIPNESEVDATFSKTVGLEFEINNMKTGEEYAQIKEDRLRKALEMKIGGYETSSKLKDWLISRQRYWGTPIPIVHCDKCGLVPVPEKDLPVELPKISGALDKTSSPLKDNTEWHKTSCPVCLGAAVRETDTMDTFVDSAWYYLRYIDNKNPNEPFDASKAKQINPVDLYIGGKEHAVLHLYYARFMSYFLYSMGLLSHPEPFKRLLVQGMVMGQSFRVKSSGQYVTEDQVDIIDKKKGKAVLKNSDEPVIMTWEKMSKSKKNGVDPQAMFNDYGTDTTRLLILADVAPTSFRHWTTATFPGILNWQRRLWLTLRDFINHRSNYKEVDFMDPDFIEHETKLFDSRNFYASGATFNYISSHQLSVAISKMQGLTNSLRRAIPPVIAQGLQYERALGCQILLLAPMAPHFASELWSGFTNVPRLELTQRNYGSKNLFLLHMQQNEFDYNKSVFEQRWPDVDLHYNLDLAIKFNGEDHSVIKIPRFKLDVLGEDVALELAKNEKSVSEMLDTLGLRKYTYHVHKGYEAELNLITKFIPKKKKKSKKQVI
ncbi:probable leucine--tRNA ligase, mitochondrial [Ctenocephalides felis]|uniref:probable leucine--tRNA ligase, mitochondrial n=1 Tax=Ctenocephalides felis TaxID=7515 RepID=UPI000E6E2596|nr:probable leucine--tRNA ligase, mitochondrial [Ctenocephalides felis]